MCKYDRTREREANEIQGFHVYTKTVFLLNRRKKTAKRTVIMYIPQAMITALQQYFVEKIFDKVKVELYVPILDDIDWNDALV